MNYDTKYTITLSRRPIAQRIGKGPDHGSEVKA